VKELRKLVNIWRIYGLELSVKLFLDSQCSVQRQVMNRRKFIDGLIDCDKYNVVLGQMFCMSR